MNWSIKDKGVVQVCEQKELECSYLGKHEICWQGSVFLQGKCRQVK